LDIDMIQSICDPVAFLVVAWVPPEMGAGRDPIPNCPAGDVSVSGALSQAGRHTDRETAGDRHV
jgi:hypothetical protein